MENIHMMVTGRIKKDGLIVRRTLTIQTNRRQAIVELKQLLRSLERGGIVHEIEDRKSEFNGMEIDYVMLARPTCEDGDGNEISDPADDYDKIEDDDGNEIPDLVDYDEIEEVNDLEDDEGIPFR
jgi:hypothetical protein